MFSPVTACKERSSIWRWWRDVESRPHKAVTFLVERYKSFRCGVSKTCQTLHQDSRYVWPLSEVVFVDDITAMMNEGNKELLEMAEKVLKKSKRAAEEKGLMLSITEGEEGRRRGLRNAARKKELPWNRVWKRWEWT